MTGLGSTISMTYDALDRRVEQGVLRGATSEILYGPNGAKLAIMSGTTVTKVFAPLSAGATAVYTSSGLAYYRHPDWLGSSRLATTPSGTVYYDGAYAPFGENYSETGTTDRNFTGQNQDLASGLYDFLYREYHSTQGRWIQPDPGGLQVVDPSDPQTWNRYAYVRNSPLASVDRLGLDNDCGGPCVPFNFTDPFGCIVSVTYTNEQSYDGQTYDIPHFTTNCGQPSSQQYGPQPGQGGGGGSATPPKSGSCDAGVIGNFVSKYVGGNTILSGNITTTGPTIELGALVGSLFGPEGTLPGALIGSMFGVGGSVSYVPGTGSIYAGPVATFGLGINGGSGFSFSAVHVPSTQNANSIANGKSFSLSYQPNPFLGSTVTKSPGSGPPVVGPSVGTKVPVSGSAGYSFCLRHCGC